MVRACFVFCAVMAGKLYSPLCIVGLYGITGRFGGRFATGFCNEFLLGAKYYGVAVFCVGWGLGGSGNGGNLFSIVISHDS